ncbi:MAG: hypothetical protein GVY11_05085 [Gammaproteobacteria bacterium]|jgi:hypothetical protein|nr:hypothetical protein [Gammaproteobacteria bacterium]
MKQLIALYALILVVPEAHAYLDPGSGSAILQGILGALAAIALTLKLYWHRLLRFFGLRKPTEGESSAAEGDKARSGSD